MLIDGPGGLCEALEDQACLKAVAALALEALVLLLNLEAEQGALDASQEEQEGEEACLVEDLRSSGSCMSRGQEPWCNGQRRLVGHHLFPILEASLTSTALQQSDRFSTKKLTALKMRYKSSNLELSSADSLHW